MKKLILTPILFLLTLIGISQNLKKITIKADTLQEINWPSNMSLMIAQKSNKMKFDSAYVGKNIYIIDLITNKISLTTQNGIIEYEIIKFEKLSYDGYYLEALSGKDLLNIKLLLSQKVGTKDYALYIMYPTSINEKKNIGYFATTTKVLIK